jgi:hypothetical protein
MTSLSELISHLTINTKWHGNHNENDSRLVLNTVKSEQMAISGYCKHTLHLAQDAGIVMQIRIINLKHN